MGLSKDRASSRINRYEREASGIDLDGLAELADTLEVPMSYLVAEDDATADLLVMLSELSSKERKQVVAWLKDKLGKD